MSLYATDACLREFDAAVLAADHVARTGEIAVVTIPEYKTRAA